MKYFAIFLIFLNPILGECQLKVNNKPMIILLPDFYKADGVIFDKDYIPPIKITENGRYTPELNDIRLAESILQKKYNQFRKTNVNVRKFFCRYLRQYLGVKNHLGDKVIIVQLIDTKNRRRFRKSIGKSYKEQFVVQFDNKIQSQKLLINLEKHTLSTQF